MQCDQFHNKLEIRKLEAFVEMHKKGRVEKYKAIFLNVHGVADLRCRTITDLLNIRSA